MSTSDETLEVVFTSPEDERWQIIRWVIRPGDMEYGLSHKCYATLTCQKITTRALGPFSCGYCGEEPPDNLIGFYKLANWER